MRIRAVVLAALLVAGPATAAPPLNEPQVRVFVDRQSRAWI